MLKKSMKIEVCMIALLSFMFLTATAFGQGTGASLTGIIQDSSGGVVPGVNIVARNVDTGVETRMTSNDRGIYTFPSLPVGTYSITASAQGFSPYNRSDVRLNVGGQVQINITLAVAGTVTEVSVTGAAESMVLEAGASTGTVLQEEILSAVPMLSNNVMDLLNMMGGVTPTTDLSFNPGLQTFAGVAGANINVSRDGLTVNEVRLSTGINASTNINTEMIGEFRMVLSPVDAEMGRGAGQVQMTTRSGSNAFHGSGVWNVQNTAFDAMDFNQKYGNIQRQWRNVNDYQITASGPIARNKTFFFATWEQQFARVKYAYTARALSTCARVGIYRYIGGSIAGAARENNMFDSSSDTRPSVDSSGNILDRQSGATFISSTDQTGTAISFDQAHPSSATGRPGMRPGDGELMFESVFGPLTPAARTLIQQDVRDVLNPCKAFAESAMWNPENGQFGTSGQWDNRPWGAGINSRDGRAYRYQYDPTGFVSRFTYGREGSNVVMPPINYWNGNGDGLNVASHRWTRSSIGGREGTIYGTGADPDRKSLTFKIDHNINNDHRVSGSYTHENYITDEGEAIWPKEYGGFGGAITRSPRNVQASVTSTLLPTLLNEFRFGYMHSNTWTSASIHQNPELARETLEGLMPSSNTNGNVALIGVGEGIMDFHTDEQTYNWGSHPVGSRGAVQASQGSIDNRWTFADTVTWMKGSHSFKGGAEYRWQNSIQQVEGNLAFGRWYGGQGAISSMPSVFGGQNGGVADRRMGTLLYNQLTQDGLAWKNIPMDKTASTDCHTSQYTPTPGSTTCPGGYANGAAGMFLSAYQLMSYFSGTVQRVSQYFYAIPDAGRPYGSRWSDPTSPNERIFETDVRNQELSFFFKDDWKVTRDLTLNLGVRWEYYGVPYAANGSTVSITGGPSNIFGVSQPIDDVTRFMYQDERKLRSEYEHITFGYLGDNGNVNSSIAPVTRYEYIGPGSPNSGRMAWNRDLNNFAPHLGFAWQLPWLGRGKTTLRGGWSISYLTVGTLGTFDGWVANVGAATLTRSEHFTGEGVNTVSGTTAHYMDLADLARTDAAGPLPMRVRSGLEPMKPLSVGYFGTNATAVDENIHSPLTHSVNVSLTRNVGRALTLDVRYIGTFQREGITGINVNQNNYINSGLTAELDKIRRNSTYQSALINSLVPDGGFGMNPTLKGLTGSDQIRNANGGGSNLAQMSYNTIVDTLATGNGGYGSVSGESGRLFRHGCLPSQRQNPNGDMADHVGNPCLEHTPLNFLRLNAQSGSATLQTNLTKSNYHSMQAQATLRPTHGLNFQATWTWSRALSDSGWSNYLGERDYTMTSQHRSHALNVFGSYELPFGPRGYLFRESSGVVKKIVEGWQISWVSALRSGSPMSITGQNTQWGTNYPVLVRSDLWDDKVGHAESLWSPEGRYLGGRYWGDRYTRVMDPGVCGSMSQSLYDQYCIIPATPPTAANPAGTPETMRTTGNMRAIAIADPNRKGEDPYTKAPYALLYDRDTIGDDGVMYRAGTPVIVFRNATGTFGDASYDPLSAGNYKANRLTSQGTFTLDGAVAKSVEFMEGKRIEVRVDAGNILNRPMFTGTAVTSVQYLNGGRIMQPSSPSNMSINATGSTALGNLPTKVGHRVFQARLSLRF